MRSKQLIDGIKRKQRNEVMHTGKPGSWNHTVFSRYNVIKWGLNLDSCGKGIKLIIVWKIILVFSRGIIASVS